MAPASPASGFHPARIVNPSHTPAPSERYTCRVPMARPMARIGGSRLVQDGSISGGMGGGREAGVYIRSDPSSLRPPPTGSQAPIV